MPVEVVPGQTSDLPFLYHLATEVEPAWLRVCGAGLPLPNRFADVVSRGLSQQFVLVGDSDLMLGAAALYDVSTTHRNGWVEVVVSPDCGDPVTVERSAFAHLLHLTFDELSLRSVFVRYPEWAPPVIDDRWEVRPVGTLSAALLHQGQYWAIGVVSIAPGGER